MSTASWPKKDLDNALLFLIELLVQLRCLGEPSRVRDADTRVKGAVFQERKHLGPDGLARALAAGHVQVLFHHCADVEVVRVAKVVSDDGDPAVEATGSDALYGV